MGVNMAAVNVGCDDSLCILTEILSHESLCYLVCELRRNVLRVGKAHNVMDGFHSAFPHQRFRAAELVPCELLINKPHLIKGLVGICGTVYRSRVEQILGLVGVQNVG